MQENKLRVDMLSERGEMRERVSAENNKNIQKIGKIKFLIRK